MFGNESVHKGKNELVSRGCIKKLLVKKVTYVFTDIPVLDSHSPYFLKNGLKLLKYKLLAIIPNYERTEGHKVGLRVAERIIIFETHFN